MIHALEYSMFTKITILTASSILLCLGVFIAWYLHQPPPNFPSGEVVTIEPSSLRVLADTLYEVKLIRSPSIFLLRTYLVKDQGPLQAGSYIFSEPVGVLEVIKQLQNGENGARIHRLTHPEGRTIAHLAEQLDTLLPDFDTQHFLAITTNDEGVLFPETYFIAPQATPESIRELLYSTYQERVRDAYATEIESHSLTELEILTLASIIEREANTPESKRMVSGILQNRLAIGMPLQADASIEYVLDKPLAELTPDDLTIDSPYNTYVNRGLPPTPINNPGLNAIKAVLEPSATEYLYYVTAPDGIFHYAKDFDEHRQNIQRYLR